MRLYNGVIHESNYDMLLAVLVSRKTRNMFYDSLSEVLLPRNFLSCRKVELYNWGRFASFVT